MKQKLVLLTGSTYLFLTKLAGAVSAQTPTDDPAVLKVKETDLGFKIPALGEFLSFMIKFFFVLAGLMALFYMLWGALSWVTSGGEADGVKKARDKIVAAAVGVILIVATLAIIVALEQIVFKESVCFGISCELRLPDLLEKCDDANDDSVCD